MIINGNNQINETGFTYDPSGNTTSDGLNSYVWNGEGQMKSAAGITYTYDGDGNRVMKTGSKIYWYGLSSEPLAESDTSGNFTDEYILFGGARVAHRVVSSNSVYYYVQDHLGTSRMMVDSTGAACYDADFTPFGGELPVTNTCAQNYKFTGKERDAETGNDDYGARSYSSNFGRFMSADWSSIPVPVPYANLTNPQTLNLYAMVEDNPTTFSDLNGHESFRGVLPTEGMDCSEGDGTGPGCSAFPPPSNFLNALADLDAFATGYYEQAAQDQQAQTLASEVPSQVWSAVIASINASNSPTADDKQGGFHEEGGIWGTKTDGTLFVSPAVPGPASKAGDVDAHMDVGKSVNPVSSEKVQSLGGTWHVHPRGGSGRTFKEPPSLLDKANANAPINFVVGAADRKVYFYNSSGVIGRPMKLKDLMKESPQ